MCLVNHSGVRAPRTLLARSGDVFVCSHTVLGLLGRECEKEAYPALPYFTPIYVHALACMPAKVPAAPAGSPADALAVNERTPIS